MKISLGNMARIFYVPTEIFSDILKNKQNNALIPLTMCVTSSILLLCIYYSYVNFDWLTANAYLGYSVEQKRVLANFLTRRTATLLDIGGVLILTPILYLPLAAYFALATKLQGSNRPFGECFRLVCWSALPAILLLPVGLIAIAMNPSGRLFPEDLNSTSLNSLIFHVAHTSPYLALLSTLNLVLVWQIALMVIGFRRATSVSTGAATMIVCAPYVLIFGVWLLVLVIGHTG